MSASKELDIFDVLDIENREDSYTSLIVHLIRSSSPKMQSQFFRDVWMAVRPSVPDCDEVEWDIRFRQVVVDKEIDLTTHLDACKECRPSNMARNDRKPDFVMHTRQGNVAPKLLVIENKVLSTEGEEQTCHYRILSEHFSKEPWAGQGHVDKLFIFLTPNRQEAMCRDFKPMSFFQMATILKNLVESTGDCSAATSCIAKFIARVDRYNEQNLARVALWQFIASVRKEKGDVNSSSVDSTPSSHIVWPTIAFERLRESSSQIESWNKRPEALRNITILTTKGRRNDLFIKFTKNSWMQCAPNVYWNPGVANHSNPMDFVYFNVNIKLPKEDAKMNKPLLLRAYCEVYMHDTSNVAQGLKQSFHDKDFRDLVSKARSRYSGKEKGDRDVDQNQTQSDIENQNFRWEIGHTETELLFEKSLTLSDLLGNDGVIRNLMEMSEKIDKVATEFITNRPGLSR